MEFLSYARHKSGDNHQRQDVHRGLGRTSWSSIKRTGQKHRWSLLGIMYLHLQVLENLECGEERYLHYQGLWNIIDVQFLGNPLDVCRM